MTVCGALRSLIGEPGEGAHSARIPLINVAAVDVAATVALAYGAHRATDVPLPATVAGLLALGAVAHYACGVDTAGARF